jgi:hypothetical protein
MDFPGQSSPLRNPHCVYPLGKRLTVENGETQIPTSFFPESRPRPGFLVIHPHVALFRPYQAKVRRVLLQDSQFPQVASGMTYTLNAPAGILVSFRVVTVCVNSIGEPPISQSFPS